MACLAVFVCHKCDTVALNPFSDVDKLANPLRQFYCNLPHPHYPIGVGLDSLESN